MGPVTTSREATQNQSSRLSAPPRHSTARISQSRARARPSQRHSSRYRSAASDDQKAVIADVEVEGGGGGRPTASSGGQPCRRTSHSSRRLMVRQRGMGRRRTSVKMTGRLSRARSSPTPPQAAVHLSEDGVGHAQGQPGPAACQQGGPERQGGQEAPEGGDQSGQSHSGGEEDQIGGIVLGEQADGQGEEQDEGPAVRPPLAEQEKQGEQEQGGGQIVGPGRRPAVHLLPDAPGGPYHQEEGQGKGFPAACQPPWKKRERSRVSPSIPPPGSAPEGPGGGKRQLAQDQPQQVAQIPAVGWDAQHHALLGDGAD